MLTAVSSWTPSPPPSILLLSFPPTVSLIPSSAQTLVSPPSCTPWTVVQGSSCRNFLTIPSTSRPSLFPLPRSVVGDSVLKPIPCPLPSVYLCSETSGTLELRGWGAGASVCRNSLLVSVKLRGVWTTLKILDNCNGEGERESPCFFFFFSKSTFFFGPSFCGWDKIHNTNLSF